jgi:hypothetical protein
MTDSTDLTYRMVIGERINPMAKRSDATREHVAWLLWCANQGYLLAEDRAVLSGGPDTFISDMQHPDDLGQLPGWLDMADQVLAAIDAEKPT